MADLIDRQAAIHEIHKQVWLAETAKTFLTEALNELPSAQPERKKGRWKREVLGSTSGYGTTVMYQCSECEQMSISKYRFCPNCGARMDGEHDE